MPTQTHYIDEIAKNKHLVQVSQYDILEQFNYKAIELDVYAYSKEEAIRLAHKEYWLIQEGKKQ